MEFSKDIQGNKYFSFEEDDDIYILEGNKIGNKLDDFEILQILSEKNDNNDQSFVAKVRSLNNNKIYSLKKLNIEVKDFQTKQKIFNFLVEEGKLRELIDSKADVNEICENLDELFGIAFQKVYAEVGKNGEKYEKLAKAFKKRSKWFKLR